MKSTRFVPCRFCTKPIFQKIGGARIKNFCNQSCWLKRYNRKLIAVGLKQKRVIGSNALTIGDIVVRSSLFQSYNGVVQDYTSIAQVKE